MNPYLLEAPAVVSFSGGRTSGYMLRKVLDGADTYGGRDVKLEVGQRWRSSAGNEWQILLVVGQSVRVLRTGRLVGDRWEPVCDATDTHYWDASIFPGDMTIVPTVACPSCGGFGFLTYVSHDEDDNDCHRCARTGRLLDDGVSGAQHSELGESEQKSD